MFSTVTCDTEQQSSYIQRTVVVVPSGGAVQTTPEGQFVISGNDTVVVPGHINKYSHSYCPLLIAGVVSMLFSIIFGLIGIVYACK